MSWPKGKPHSGATKAKISSTLKGRKCSPLSAETRAKIGAGHRGKTLSAEHRAKLSLAHRGKSPGNKGKPAWNKGKPHSAETRAKITAAHRTPEYQAKLSPVLGECVYCFGPATQRDHIIPRGRPGWDNPDNIVLACRFCNRDKGARTPEEWFGLAPLAKVAA
jgi:5-methylcytosine-specific restriction endonuclease McrA